MNIIKLFLKYIDPAYYMYVRVPPEIIKYRNKFIKNNFEISNWYKPGLFATAISLATIKIIFGDQDKEYFNLWKEDLFINITKLFKQDTGGFKNYFSDRNASLEATHSALRIIKLLYGENDEKWAKGNYYKKIDEILGTRLVKEKIISFIDSHFNRIDGGYTKIPGQIESDITSTNSARWILFQLNAKIENDIIRKNTEFIKNICEVNSQDKSIMKCRFVISNNAESNIRATVQSIDLITNIEKDKEAIKYLNIPNEWTIDNENIRNNMVELYDSLRLSKENFTNVYYYKYDKYHFIQLINKSLKLLEYEGGFCFSTESNFVPNLLATYYALAIKREINRETKIEFTDIEKKKVFDFIKSCWSNEGLFRLYPYFRKYYRL